MAALECICIMNDKKIYTNHPIEIVGFNAEEGSEMGGTFGSRVMLGKQDLDDTRLPNKLNNYNLTIESLKNSIKDISQIKAFLELHIEQGGFLDRNNLQIGVVECRCQLPNLKSLKISKESNIKKLICFFHE